MVDRPEWFDDVRAYAKGSQKYPYTNWAREDISIQMIWVDGELDAMIEVIQSYNDFNEIGNGELAGDASGELSDVANHFTDAIEQGQGSQVQLPYLRTGTNDQGVPAVFYGKTI